MKYISRNKLLILLFEKYKSDASKEDNICYMNDGHLNVLIIFII